MAFEPANVIGTSFNNRNDFDLDGLNGTTADEQAKFDKLDTNNNGWLDEGDIPVSNRPEDAVKRNILREVYTAGVRVSDAYDNAAARNDRVRGSDLLGRAVSRFSVVAAFSPPGFLRGQDACANLGVASQKYQGGHPAFGRYCK